jgi:hypothetical protein
MCQGFATQVRYRQLAEDVVDHGSRHLNMWTSIDRSAWLELGKCKDTYKFFERYTVSQAELNGDSEAVGQATESGAYRGRTNPADRFHIHRLGGKQLCPPIFTF